MIRNRVLAAIVLLAWLGAAPTWAANRCAGGGAPRPDDSGVGGTGMSISPPDGDDSGVGGTGKRAASPDDDDSGVGGTGVSAQADTGVIGTITGFASICVGEVEITYDPTSAVKIDGVAATPAQLAVGQVVEVMARGNGNELGAREIAVQHIVGGPVTHVSPEGGEIDVIGQRVRLTPTTRGDAADTLALGTFVRVSGMREADGTIVASRVTPGGDGVARLAGPVDAIGSGMIAVAGTPVLVPTSLELSSGDEVRVVGSWEGDRLVASSVEPVPHIPFGGKVARVDVEGYARLTSGGDLRVGPYRFAGSSDAVAAVSALDPQAPVRVELTVRDGRAVIERIDSVPNLPPRPDAGNGRGPGYWDSGGGAHDAAGHDIERPPRGARGAMPADDQGGAGPPAPPDRPVDARPPADVRPPDRPPHVDRPPMDRPDLPSRPERPPRPGRP